MNTQPLIDAGAFFLTVIAWYLMALVFLAILYVPAYFILKKLLKIK